MSSEVSVPLVMTRPGVVMPPAVWPKVTLRLPIPLTLTPTTPARVNWLVLDCR